MPTDEDRRLLDAAVQEGLITREAADDALRAQATAQAVGVEKPLAEILVKKRLLSQGQIDNLLGPDVSDTLRGTPERIGPYIVRSTLGRGAMGVVYRAAKKDAPDVALKVLAPELSGSPEAIQRFLREAESAQKLSDPRVVRILDHGRSDGRYYLAMELVEGETLEARFQRENVLAEKEALRIAREVSLALEHARERNIVHRDVKPSNILLTREGAVKLADFGLAKETGGASLTVTGVALGTPHYISPEQARGERLVDSRSDIYSLGATLYRMVTGSVPFPGTSAAVILAKHLTESLPSPRDRNPGLSDACCRILERMMAKAPEDRYGTPGALSRDLAAALAGREPETVRLAAGLSVILPPGAVRRKALESARIAAVLETLLMGLVVLVSGHALRRVLGTEWSPGIFAVPLVIAIIGFWALRGARLWRGSVPEPSRAGFAARIAGIVLAFLLAPFVASRPAPAPPSPRGPSKAAVALREADAAFAQGDYRGAIERLKAVAASSESPKPGSDLAKRLEAKRAEFEAKKAAEEEDYRRTSTEAESALDRGDFTAAMEAYYLVTDPDSRFKGLEIRRRAGERYREIQRLAVDFERVNDAADRGDYWKALQDIHALLAAAPKGPEAGERRRRLESRRAELERTRAEQAEAYRRIAAEAEACLARKDTDAALEHYHLVTASGSQILDTELRAKAETRYREILARIKAPVLAKPIDAPTPAIPDPAVPPKASAFATPKIEASPYLDAVCLTLNRFLGEMRVRGGKRGRNLVEEKAIRDAFEAHARAAPDAWKAGATALKDAAAGLLDMPERIRTSGSSLAGKTVFGGIAYVRIAEIAGDAVRGHQGPLRRPVTIPLSDLPPGAFFEMGRWLCKPAETTLLYAAADWVPTDPAVPWPPVEQCPADLRAFLAEIVERSYLRAYEKSLRADTTSLRYIPEILLRLLPDARRRENLIRLRGKPAEKPRRPQV